MAMTSVDYMTKGRVDAEAGAASLSPTMKTGWQRDAYERGYAEGAKAKAKSHPGARRAGKSVANAMQALFQARFENWPGAAAEHARRLAQDLADEKNGKRRDRLMRAFKRMTKRHGPPVEPTPERKFAILGIDECA